ncbi:LAFE_0G16644g1_1 [Lachancea fermentati]|uniref:Phospholipid scramblase n=1 Tax=Lachancea fermentati TaxID=4955 RepID=A0A1G4MIZ3_LACFM|nr:LAFE_0G16644g1_1 [Lachancea fermentati]
MENSINLITRNLSRRWYSPLPRSIRKRPLKHKPAVLSSSDSNTSSNSIIQPYHPIATTILNEPTIVVERQIEMMNVFLGYEQANKYAIMDVMGNRIGYMQERDFSLTKMIMRQFYRLHRPFLVDVFDNWGNVILTIKRPFSWINSHIKAILPEQTAISSAQTSDPYVVKSPPFGSVPEPQSTSTFGEGGTLVGESIQNWHLWRRRYELFQRDSQDANTFAQFAQIDAPFLSFEFPLVDQAGKIMGSVDRNWVGLGRELFTDTGVYVIRMDTSQSYEGVYPPEVLSSEILSLDQRAVLLANAVSIDFDYFSRHSGHGGGLVSFGDYGE